MDVVTAKSANGASDPGLVSALVENGVEGLAAPPAQTPDQPSAETAPMADVVAAGAAASEIKLTFVNRSNDTSNSRIVIFGRAVAAPSAQLDEAWQVISDCGPGWSRPFVWPAAVSIGVVDPNGNVSPRLDIADGQLAQVEASETGTVLRIADETGSQGAVAIINRLPRGVVAATVFKDGKPYGRQSLWPNTVTTFSFPPTIWIGVAKGGEDGGPAVVSQPCTEINLMGLAGADIVMTGGGPGAEARPFVFTLQNVVYA